MAALSGRLFKARACRVPAFDVSKRHVGMSTFLSQKRALQSKDTHSVTSTTPTTSHHGDASSILRRRRDTASQHSASARRRASKRSHRTLPSCAKQRIPTVEPTPSAGQCLLQIITTDIPLTTSQGMGEPRRRQVLRSAACSRGFRHREQLGGSEKGGTRLLRHDADRRQ